MNQGDNSHQAVAAFYVVYYFDTYRGEGNGTVGRDGWSPEP